MDIKSISGQNFTGNAFFVDLNRLRFLDLKISQHRKQLPGISHRKIKQINNFIQEKPFDVFILRGDEQKGEYFIYAGNNIEEVRKNPKVNPTTYRTTCATDDFIKEVHNAVAEYLKL